MKTVKETLISWFQNAAVERLAYIAIGIVVVLVITALIKRVVNNKIVNTDHRYRVRKAVNFIGYLLILLILLLIYGDRLGNLGVALGVAGAGVTFALQEFIVSFVG